MVLTAGIDEWEAGFPDEVARAYENLWLELQKELAALSTHSTHQVVADSDHIIHEGRPDLVLEAVRQLLRL